MFNEIRVVVVVDYVGLEGLKTGRILKSPSLTGLSIYVKAKTNGGNEVKLLFDTSSSWSLLSYNSKVLGIDLKDLDAVVISHWHIDHTGGLPKLMEHNPEVPVYAPPQGTKLSPLDMFVHFRLPREVNIVNRPKEILRGVFLTGPLSAYFPLPPFRVREQALSLKISKESSVVLVGCSHPKPYRLVEESLRASGAKNVKLLVGGLHLIFPTTRRKARRIVDRLASMPIEKVAPVHCSGDRGRALVKRVLKERYLDVVAGDVINVTDEEIEKLVSMRST